MDVREDPEQLIQDTDARRMLGGISRATYWRRSKESDFPEPIEIGGKKFRNLHALRAYIGSKRKPRAA